MDDGDDMCVLVFWFLVFGYFFFFFFFNKDVKIQPGVCPFEHFRDTVGDEMCRRRMRS